MGLEWTWGIHVDRAATPEEVLLCLLPGLGVTTRSCEDQARAQGHCTTVVCPGEELTPFQARVEGKLLKQTETQTASHLPVALPPHVLREALQKAWTSPGLPALLCDFEPALPSLSCER